MATFEHNFEISFRDVNIDNEVCTKKLLEFLEDIGGLHSDTVGYGFNNIEETNLTWVLLYWKLRIFKRPSSGQIIKIRTWARNSTRVHTFRDFEIYDIDGNLIALASSKWILLNAKTMSIEKIHPEIIEKYEPENVLVFKEETEIGKLLEPTEYSSTFTYTILRKDIDINNHVHNTFYLDLAYETLPNEIYSNIDFNNIEIMYKKEIKLGETIKCLYSNIDDEHYVTIKSKDEKILHAIIKLKK